MRTLSISMKLVASTTDAEREAILGRITALVGVQNVEQLFPTEPDADLVCLYLVYAQPDAADTCTKAIAAMPGIEWAQVTPPRRLIRPV